MPSVSRRKAKQAKRLKTLTTLNHHSSSADQLQGVAVSVDSSKKMEESLNGTLQESQQKVETQSSSEHKDAAVEVVDDDSPDVDVAITDEEVLPQSEENKVVVESGKVEEETHEDVSESVAETVEPDAVKDVQVDNSVESVNAVELELKEEKGEDFVPHPDVVNDEVKETDLPTSVSVNEGLIETEVVGEEENNVLSSVVETDKLLRESEESNEVHGDSSFTPADVASEETVDSRVPKSDESEKVAPTIIEKSLDLEPTLDEKVEAPSGGQEESSYESAKESLRPSPSLPVPESTENPTIAPVAQTESSSWKSCCGILEIIIGGGR